MRNAGEGSSCRVKENFSCFFFFFLLHVEVICYLEKYVVSASGIQMQKVLGGNTTSCNFKEVESNLEESLTYLNRTSMLQGSHSVFPVYKNCEPLAKEWERTCSIPGAALPWNMCFPSTLVKFYFPL